MQKESHLLDDLAKLASGAAGSMLGMKRELEAMMQQKLESWIDRMQLVTREEFETQRALVAKLTDEIEALKAAFPGGAAQGDDAPKTGPRN